MAIKDIKRVQTPEEAKENGRKGGLKSGQLRRERALLKKLGYTGVESFDKLTQLQNEALASGNINAAIKAEELKGKLAGLYVEKQAQTDSEGNDKFEPPIFKIVPVEVVHDKQTDDAEQNAVLAGEEEQV